jgi:hypothetical protein
VFEELSGQRKNMYGIYDRYDTISVHVAVAHDATIADKIVRGLNLLETGLAKAVFGPDD